MDTNNEHYKPTRDEADPNREIPARTQVLNKLGIHPLSYMRLTPVAFEVKKFFGTCPNQ